MNRRRARPQNMSIYGDLSECWAPIGPPGRGTWDPVPGTASNGPSRTASSTPACLRLGAWDPRAGWRVGGVRVSPGGRGVGCRLGQPAGPAPGLPRAVGEGPTAPRNCLARGWAARAEPGCVPAALPRLGAVCRAPPTSFAQSVRREPRPQRLVPGWGRGGCGSPPAALNAIWARRPGGTPESRDDAPATTGRSRPSPSAATTAQPSPPGEGVPCLRFLAVQRPRPH